MPGSVVNKYRIAILCLCMAGLHALIALRPSALRPLWLMWAALWADAALYNYWTERNS